MFKLSDDLSTILDFLCCKTPDQWIEKAVQHQNILLIDHAHCEKKAASAALSLISRYADKYDLLQKMSRLAREELRHFEMVLKIMRSRKIAYTTLAASGYIRCMYQHISTREPEKLVDTLIIGAIIEARSCERFAAIAPFLDRELQDFYTSLLKSEGRHFKSYLQLARQYSDTDIAARVQLLTQAEGQYISAPDTVFRFHSGI